MDSLIAQREARMALAVWLIVPTLFIFFALSLAVDPAANIDRVRLGVAVLDTGGQSPQGPIAVGPRLAGALEEQLGTEVVVHPDDSALRAAVLNREVAAGIVVPPGTTQRVLAGQPAALELIRSDANDPFTNALTANLADQLTAAMNAGLPRMLDPGAAGSPLVTVNPETVASTTDYRFATVAGAMVLPVWLASLGFAALVTRAGDQVRTTRGTSATSVRELGFTLLAAGAVALVLVLTLGLTTLRWDLDWAGLFGFLWLGLAAIALLLLGLVRAIGLGLGALLGLLALFAQQPISGAAYPASFAPDAVRWLEPVAPLRYLVEGTRNVLIGGSTTPDMVLALTVIGLTGGGLALIGYLRLAAGWPRATGAPVPEV